MTCRWLSLQSAWHRSKNICKMNNALSAYWSAEGSSQTFVVTLCDCFHSFQHQCYTLLTHSSKKDHTHAYRQFNTFDDLQAIINWHWWQSQTEAPGHLVLCWHAHSVTHTTPQIHICHASFRPDWAHYHRMLDYIYLFNVRVSTGGNVVMLGETCPRGQPVGYKTGVGQIPTPSVVNRLNKSQPSASDATVAILCLLCAVGNMECLQTWTEGNRKYVIARRLRDGTASIGANCFVSRCRLMLSLLITHHITDRRSFHWNKHAHELPRVSPRHIYLLQYQFSTKVIFQQRCNYCATRTIPRNIIIPTMIIQLHIII